MDDNDANFTQVSFVYKGTLKIDSVASIEIHPANLVNDTVWYRNLSMDEEAMKPIYQKQVENS